MLIDSWVWIELFKKSPKTWRILELLRGQSLFTSVLSISEVAFWCVRNGVPVLPYLDAIRKNANVLLVNEEQATIAGADLPRLRASSPGMGIVDSIIYSQATSAGLSLVTGDPHFKGLPGVRFID